ncbi:MAG: internal scaffolding protein [Microvirus sp.]|nr:MAG: internal scaffolding protein [Microvirus sp.]
MDQFEDWPVFLRTPYNYDRNKASDDSGLACRGPGRTQQSFKEECDINTIVRRFGITGQLPTGVRMPSYGDFTGVGDFQEAMNAIVSAQESFAAMPASVRKRFGNDPAAFVDFCSDEANRAEAEKLGLVPAQEVAKAVSVLSPTPTPTPAAAVAPGASGKV